MAVNHNIYKEIANIFPDSIREGMKKILKRPNITEIRLRVGSSVMICTTYGDYFFQEDGELTVSDHEGYLMTPEIIKLIFQRICQYSVFAFKEELREGFITLKGGHRVGLCGKIYYDAEGKRQIQHISSMNIRIARQLQGCSEEVFPWLTRGKEFLNTLLISPPGGGKTTYLRDLIRLISDGTPIFPGKHISVVDERSEIGNRTRVSEGFYLGKRTDLMDSCPKAEGMLMMLRSMGPQVIAADEIGDSGDIDALRYIRNCGCQLLMTVHGYDLEDIYRRPYLGPYLEKYPFDRYLILRVKQGGKRSIEVYDHQSKKIWTNGIT